MSKDATRVLWVAPWLSAMPRTGGSIRSYRLLRAVAEAYPTDVVSLSRDLDPDALRRDVPVERVVIAPAESSSPRRRLRALRHGWPIPTARLFEPAAAAVVSDLGAGAVVVLDHVLLFPYRPARPYVLSTHNIEAPLLRSLPPAHGLRRVERAWDTRALARWEARAFRDTNAHVVVVSATDAAAVGSGATIIPNGTDIPRAPAGVPRQSSLLFVGSLDYEPNRGALEWWIREVAPHLAPELPPLTVIGRGGEHLEGFAEHPGLRLRGEVADIAEDLAAASVVVVPLRHGGGTRLKVLEALAWSRPVVSTSKGAEGLPVRSGEHLLIADDGRSFAEAVARLWHDTGKARELGRRGRAIAESFGWRAIGSAFVDLVRVVGERGTRSF